MMKINGQILNTKLKRYTTINCPTYVEQKLIGLEDRSRRDNLRVDGILKTSGETWEDCEGKLQQVFQEKLCLEFPI